MRVSVLLILSGALLGLTGCSTTQKADQASSTSAASGKPKGPTRADVANSMRALQKGMTTEQVRAAWGAPVSVKPMEAPVGTAEVWIYKFSFVGEVRQVQTDEITYTRPNPLTGIDETIREPVYSTEQVMVDQTVELLFYDGRLTEWKQSREVNRTFH
jgi:hypothetical protein